MTFTMHHGVTLHTGFAVQEVEVKSTQQLSKVQGMVNGRTENVAGFPHTDDITGTVRGKGDMTISPGIGSANVSGITGGLTHIGEVGVKETLGTEAEWNYAFNNLPHAA